MGGDNAEAYFSPDGKKLTLQVTNKQFGVACDQIYSLDLTQPITDFNQLKLVSTGKGRTTCFILCPMENTSFMLPHTRQIKLVLHHQNRKMVNIYGLYIF